MMEKSDVFKINGSNDNDDEYHHEYDDEYHHECLPILEDKSLDYKLIA